MKFNEKLINLRKQKGLSQEELGYKLEVTRQTVSKWELGETTPEMSKLIEMSKIFGVSLDELTNEEAKIEDKPINEKPIKNNSTLKIVIVIVIIILLFFSLILFLFFSHIFKIADLGKNMSEQVLDKGIEIINEMQDKIDTNFNETNQGLENQIEDENFSEEYEQTKAFIEQQTKEIFNKKNK